MGLQGQRLRNIEVHELLGRGGMGEVYLGFDEVLQRRVALKVLRSKCLDEESKARFLREARVLSQLDHPRICRIHDSLEHEGQQILVLEFLEGESLRELMQRGITEKLRLRLALQLTEALAAAHGAGVIHRDLKPDNVIVDADGHLKVLDFGLARREFEAGPDGPTPAPKEPGSPSGRGGHDDHDSPAGLTSHGSLMGTAAYMSPEQALGEAITTASDMYSLGIIFHELFTGEAAYDPDLPLLAKAQKAAAADTRPVHGVAKELADLIRRLEAKEPSTRPRAVDVLERLRHFEARPGRRRRLLAVAAVCFVLVAMGVKYTVDLRLEQDRTLVALAAAEEAKSEAQQVSDFLVEVFSISDPSEARGNQVRAREILDAGAERLRHELAEQPLVRARLIGTVGRVYHQLGLHHEANAMLAEALELHRRLLPDGHPDLCASLHRLGAGYYMVDRYDEARALFEECLTMRRKADPPDGEGVAATLEDLGQIMIDEGRLLEARELLTESLGIRRVVLDADDPQLATGLWTLATVLTDEGDMVEAEKLYREAEGILEGSEGENLPILARILEGHGALYLRQGRNREAEPYFRRALDIRVKVLDPGHQNLGISDSYLAMVVSAEGRYDEAESLLREALAIFEDKLGAEHFNVGASLILLGGIHLDTGRLDEAESEYSRALSIFETAGLRDNYNALTALQRLGDVARRRGRWLVAEAQYRAALAGWERSLGLQSVDGVETLLALAEVLEHSGRLDDADAMRRRSMELAEAIVSSEGANPFNVLTRASAALHWGQVLERDGGEKEARRLWSEAEAACHQLAGSDEEVELLAVRARLLLSLGRDDDAAPLVERLAERGWVDGELIRR